MSAREWWLHGAAVLPYRTCRLVECGRAPDHEPHRVAVLDPESDGDVDALTDAMAETLGGAGSDEARGILDRLTRPPRIPEPALWGVVKAKSPKANIAEQWVHRPDGLWHTGQLSLRWDDLIDPVLVREGVDDD